MRFAVIFPLVFQLFFFWADVANAEGPEASFTAGIAAFQKGDLKQARASFIDALKAGNENPAVLFNLGLVEEKSGQLGMAMGLWRKALAEDPEYSPAVQALTWAQTRQERAAIPHEVELWENFRKSLLAPISLDKYLLATALLMFLSGWLVFAYLGRRRRARLDEQSPPGFPVIAALTGVAFAVALFCTLAKAFDMTIVRGTITLKKIEARSSPDNSATPLFDLYEGLEVVLRSTTQSSNGEWAQVTYPGGSTGWIPRSAIFAINDPVKAAP